MDDQKRDLDRRIRRAQRMEFFRQLREGWMAIALGVGLLAAIFMGGSFAATPQKLQATVIGHVVEEANARTNKQGALIRHEVVKLDDGAIIDVSLTSDKPLNRGDALKIEIYEKDWGPLHQTSYRFAGYPGEAPHS